MKFDKTIKGLNIIEMWISHKPLKTNAKNKGGCLYMSDR